MLQEQEGVRWEQQRQFAQEEAQRQAQLAQYQDELARKRLAQEHELERQRNAELVKMQEESGVKREMERLRIEQQIQAERRAADQHAVRGTGGGVDPMHWEHAGQHRVLDLRFCVKAVKAAAAS